MGGYQIGQRSIRRGRTSKSDRLWICCQREGRRWSSAEKNFCWDTLLDGTRSGKESDLWKEGGCLVSRNSSCGDAGGPPTVHEGIPNEGNVLNCFQGPTRIQKLEHNLCEIPHFSRSSFDVDPDQRATAEELLKDPFITSTTASVRSI